MGEVLRVQGLCFGYENGLLLDHISFHVERGTLLGVIGPNGSGKSTLLRLIDGILLPQKGKIDLLGKPIERFGRKELSKVVALVCQEIHFRFAFSALEVVLMGRFPHLSGFQLEGRRDLEIAKEAMRLTNTLYLAKRGIHELSGGERQRVLLAMALAQEPTLLLLDEPTSFLDPRYKIEIFSLIKALIKEKGLSGIVVTHDLDLSAQFCDSFLLLKDGKILAQGAPERVLSRENLALLYGCDAVVDQNPVTKSVRISLIPTSTGGVT